MLEVIMDNYLTLLYTVSLVVFLYSIFKGQESFMLVNMLTLACFGAGMVIAPSIAFIHESSSSDGVQLHMTRTCGCVQLGMAAVWYFLHDSGDATVSVVLLMSRLVGLTLVVVGSVHYHMRTNATDFGTFYIFIDVLLTLGNLYFLLRLHEWGGHTQLNTRINFHLRVDFFVTLVFGIVLYAFPEWLLEGQITLKVTPRHEFIATMIGGFMIESAIISSYSPGFINEQDQRVQLVGRIVQNSLLLAVMIFAQTYYNTWTVYHIYFGMVGCIIWTANAFSGYMAPSEMDELKLN